MRHPRRNLSLATAWLMAVSWFTLSSDTVRNERAATPLATQSVGRSDPQAVLAKYCVGCHGPDEQEAGVRFDALELMDPVAAQELFTNARELVHLEEMPPDDAKQPTAAERKVLLDWLEEQLTGDAARRLAEKLQRPEAGNYVDHDALFSGQNAHRPGFTPDRRWLISEFIFDAKINDLIDRRGVRTIDGRRQNVVGDNGVGLGTRMGGNSLRERITNPFLLPAKIGVRYYSNESLAPGHLLTMISNAKRIAAYMVSEKTMKAHYPAMLAVMRVELEQRQRLRSREAFLEAHIERVLEDVFGKRHAMMLPKFVAAQVDDPPDLLDRKGNPAPRKTNLEVLRRYGREDLDAIHLGMDRYTPAGIAVEDVPFESVIDRCEREWFRFGVDDKRIANRVSIMKVLHKHWDMELVYDNARKRKPELPAYRPLAAEEMAVVTRTLREHRRDGDRFRQVIDRCLDVWREEFRVERGAAGDADGEALGKVVEELYGKVLRRAPSTTETRDGVALLRSCMARLDTQGALAKLAESLILSSEYVYRAEFGQGESDEHGRRMMSPRDASYALAYALTDSDPDAELTAAAAEGRLSTREDYRREVERMLRKRDQYYVIDERVQKGGFNASVTNQPIRKLRFFREFFGYPSAIDVFKDDVRFGAGRHEQMVSRLIDEADLLVSHILEQDERVFERLLATEKFYVYHSGDNAAMTAASDRQREIYGYFKDLDWREWGEEELYAHLPFIQRMKMRGTVFPDFAKNQKRRRGWVRSFQRVMESLEARFGDGQQTTAPFDILPMAYWHKGNATGRTGQVMRNEQVATYFNIDVLDWDYPTEQPARVQNRRGMLTHPAWLIAHSLNTETDPVRRGKWVREKLLAGTVPDVPITVDAVIPEDHHKTLRQRLEKRTGDAYCWNCHQRMDPLGLPFEIYDDFGRYRTRERLEHAENLITAQKAAPRVEGVQLAVYRTLPVDARGVVDSTGDPELDGAVVDALDLADRLARSPRARQSILRHAFRFFMGRNETLSDSKTLIDAEKAYLDSGGSFDAVIVSLLTSDSFVYRKPSDQ